MKADVTPLLPMNLPEINLAPSAAPEAQETQTPPAPDLDNARDSQIQHVGATALFIDARFGMSHEELARCHADAIAAARSDLYLGRPQSGFPIVTPSDDGRYAVLTELPLALAALDLAREEVEPVTIMVVVTAQPHGAALLSAMLDGPRTPTLYEQSCYIRGCTAKYEGRRAWMAAEQIDLKRWEGRFSKIAKIGQLDPDLLVAIDPFSITNVEVAGRIVDIWADPVQRAVAKEVVARETLATNARLKAPALFKKIINAIDGVGSRFTITPWRDGACEMRSPDGHLIAVAHIAESGWSITGGDASTMTSAAIGALYRALQARDSINGRS